jgi:MOSC domain-containing protein YiiM
LYLSPTRKILSQENCLPLQQSRNQFICMPPKQIRLANPSEVFMLEAKQLSRAELEAGLDTIRQSPKQEGGVILIVRRPATDEREVLEEGELNLLEGLAGDTWKTLGSSRTPDGAAHPDNQLTLMNARVIALLAQTRDRWSLAGDQLYVDLDLSVDNLPAGTRLVLGTAVIEVTALPHTGCKKFMARFGLDALQFVNSPVGKQLRLRGLNARVVQAGVIRAGDWVKKL